MYFLTTTRAIALVRKNLDEIGFNDSGMLAMQKDALNLDATIACTLPESINAIHRLAPVTMLDGLTVEPEAVTIGEDGVMGITADIPYLRLVAFRASDSEVVVSEPVEEYSPQGRMQLNKYVRGTYDNPVLVVKQGRGSDFDTHYEFRYYSIRSAAATIAEFEYIPRHKFEDSSTGYHVADALHDAVIDRLTGDVLTIYNEAQKAENFYRKITL